MEKNNKNNNARLPSNNKYSQKVNKKKVHVKNGIRQVDALTVVVFITVMDSTTKEMANLGTLYCERHKKRGANER